MTSKSIHVGRLHHPDRVGKALYRHHDRPETEALGAPNRAPGGEVFPVFPAPPDSLSRVLPQPFGGDQTRAANQKAEKMREVAIDLRATTPKFGASNAIRHKIRE